MVYLLLADGFEEVEAILTLDLIRRANIDIKTVGISALKVTGAHNITVWADILIEDARKDIDMLILPGGSAGTANLDASAQVHRLLDLASEQGAYIAAICAAPMILGKRGMLYGKRAVCYPGFEKWLRGAEILHDKVVRDGKFITGAGMGVTLQFGLELVSILRSRDTADKIKDGIIV